MQTSRRKLLLTGAAAGAGLTTSAFAKAAPPKFDEVYDVVVVGSGIAGTMAALVAAKNGAKTLLIEKLNRLGGTSRYSGLDFACVGSDMQKAAGITDTPEAMVADMAKVAANLSDRARALNIARETARAQKIMLEHGVKWTKILKLGGHSEKRCLIAEGGGSGILRSLWASYERYPNLKVSPATKLDELILDEKGGVIGVEVRKDYLFDASLASDDRENHSGTKVRIGARQAVIMATGGYARDKEFMKHEVPFLEHTLNSASEGATSGALKSMIRAGARPVQLSLYRFSFALPTEDLIWGVAIDAATGARYANEALGRNPISTASLSAMAKEGAKPYIIWDEKGLTKFHNMARVARSMNGLNGRNGTMYKFATLDEVAAFYNTDAAKLKATITEYNRMIAAGKDEKFMKPLERSGRKVEPLSETGPFYNLPYLTDAVVKEKAVWGIADSSDPEKVKAALKYNDPKYAVRGDTWEALAAAMGVPPDALARTMKDYNAACTTGDDKAFGKAKEFLKPFAKPPFFAVRVVPKTGGTIGGVKVNDKFQVVREDGSVIKGLYAGGEVINRPYYNRVYTSGTGLGIAYTSGRIAGTNAAAER